MDGRKTEEEHLALHECSATNCSSLDTLNATHEQPTTKALPVGMWYFEIDPEKGCECN